MAVNPELLPIADNDNRALYGTELLEMLQEDVLDTVASKNFVSIETFFRCVWREVEFTEEPDISCEKRLSYAIPELALEFCIAYDGIDGDDYEYFYDIKKLYEIGLSPKQISVIATLASRRVPKIEIYDKNDV